MYTIKKYAYDKVRNYICSQIAYEKEKLNRAIDAMGEDEYTEERHEEIDAYKAMLNVLSNEKTRICK